MKITRARALLAAAAVSGSLGVAVLVSARPASAAPVTLSGCLASTGSTDTESLRITLDDSILTPGTVIPLHDRKGRQTDGFYNGVTYNPNLPQDAMSAPVCGVQKLADGTLSYAWLYCTEEPKSVCGNAPWTQSANGAAALTDLDKARLAWIIDNPTPEANNATDKLRAQRQRLIWCVTSKFAANVEAPAYLAGEASITCPNWPAIDPTLNLTPTLALGQSTPGPVNAGQAITFTVTTNVSPVAITFDGLATMGLCPGQNGVTLTAGELAIADPTGGASVQLCATAGTGTAANVKASMAAHTVSTLQFWQRPVNSDPCQGMLTTEINRDLPGVSATAQLAIVPTIDTTVTTPPVIDSTTVTTDPGTSTTGPVVLDTTIPVTLPRTGAAGQTGPMTVGVLLLVLGVGLVLASRREAGVERR